MVKLIKMSKMEFKGTKGPWAVFYTKAMGDISGKIHEIVVMPDRKQANQSISISWDIDKIDRNGGLTLAEAKANAKLIAAAPDILNALQLTLNLLKDGYVDAEVSPTIEIAEKAINKALNN